MTEPILDPAYWKKRLEEAKERHHSIFRCPLDRWKRIESKHASILCATLREDSSVLDVGCGYGRLLTLMPTNWTGEYVGVDLSPDFIEIAEHTHPERVFMVGDVTHPIQARLPDDKKFDWSVLVSIRPMIRRNLGEDVWARVRSNIAQVATRILYLEYDESEEGEVEVA